MPALDLVDAVVRGGAVALLAVLALAVRGQAPPSPARAVVSLFCLGLVVQVVSSMPAVETGARGAWQAPLVAISMGNAVLFWVFAHAMFDDGFAWRRRYGWAWGAVAALGLLVCLFARPGHDPTVGFLRLAQRAVPVCFAALAVRAAVVHWQSDLVEPRRRLRVYVLAMGLGYSLWTAATRALSPGGLLPAPVALLDAVFLLVLLAVPAASLLQMRGLEALLPLPARTKDPSGATSRAADEVVARHSVGDPDTGVPACPPSTPSEPDPADDQLAADLQHAMVEQRAYETENLTVAHLAARLGVPAYRLRRVIHQRMGHRNFNAFVNAYRLQAAAKALCDPEQQRTPVMTIAMDAGFQSIGPFNRAFKATFGLTPTEFRRAKAGAAMADG